MGSMLYREFPAFCCASALEHSAAAARLHPASEPVLSHALFLFRLVGSLGHIYG